MYAIGIDIGGTKCAVTLGELGGAGVTVLHKCAPHPTAGRAPEEMLALLGADARDCMARAPAPPAGIGVSCGGPLDSRTGEILSPPNLPGWDKVPVTAYMSRKTGLPAWLSNDANACALAEWRYGAGEGCGSMAFLTFGTGLGAGLVLDGRLYEGACGMAGEAGHIRLSGDGPAGYGKTGSFEGYCSGGGIAQLAKTALLCAYQRGERPALCPDPGGLEHVTAETVGRAAKAGDPFARALLERVGTRLGQGLSILIDLLNPERIVIGSIFARCYEELWPAVRRAIEAEALAPSAAACRVLPSRLSESVGDIAALTVAFYHLNWGNEL